MFGRKHACGLYRWTSSNILSYFKGSCFKHRPTNQRVSFTINLSMCFASSLLFILMLFSKVMWAQIVHIQNVSAPPSSFLFILSELLDKTFRLSPYLLSKAEDRITLKSSPSLLLKPTGTKNIHTLLASAFENSTQSLSLLCK